jgi:DNA-binding NtrC family response regulator
VAELRVLVVEDEESLSQLLCEVLEQAGFETVSAPTIADARKQLARIEPDVIFLDMNLPDGSGLEVLRQVREENLPTEVIVLTGDTTLSTAVGAMKLGAYDYLSKPPRPEELEALALKGGEKARLLRENAALHRRLEREQTVPGLITDDPALKSQLGVLLRAAGSELPILIQGESGTGKELIARAVHKSSPRAAFPFVAVNCAAVPENLVESELFGHEKGAFTGASDRKPGLFEVAGSGVVFLDEIGEIATSVQAKLLRALETREFFRVGGTRVIKSQARVVAASNRDLLSEAEAGRFRQDLYFRLAGVILTVPPLRERPKDVRLLAHHFLTSVGCKKAISPEALAALDAYSWPGNVRELRMVMERTAILAAGEAILPTDLRLGGPRPRTEGPWRIDMTLAEVEDAHIRAVLEHHKGRRAKAARALGIDPKTLYNKLGPEKARE